MVQSLRLYHFLCPNEGVWISGIRDSSLAHNIFSNIFWVIFSVIIFCNKHMRPIYGTPKELDLYHQMNKDEQGGLLS